MVRQFILPVIAVAGVVMTVYTVKSQAKPGFAATNTALAEPTRSPWENTVSGSGLIEALSENITIGTPTAGVVQAVLVKAGESVSAGQPLFQIDDRSQRALLAERRAHLKVAESELARLRALPWSADLPPAQARLEAAKANAAEAERDLQRATELGSDSAISNEELERRRFSVTATAARVAEAKADVDRLLAGAWEKDVLVAEAEVSAARAAVEATEVELEKLTVRAPIAAQILDCNVRPGQYAAQGLNEEPLLVLGETKTLVARVDIDENDAWRVKPGAAATASLRGNSAISTPVTFLRVEPLVIPKKSLTGQSTERVDTRVLQVLYIIDDTKFPAYVGQLIDVRIDAPKDGSK